MPIAGYTPFDTDAVQRVYELQKKAAKGRSKLDESIKLNLTQQYHRVLRESPEAKYVKPLTSVRKQLDKLAAERVKVENDDLQTAQIDAAMKQLAGGTIIWLTDKLGVEQPPEPQEPPAVE